MPPGGSGSSDSPLDGQADGLGAIAGGWVPQPYVAEMVADGGHVLVNEKTLWPGGLFSTTEVIARKELEDLLQPDRQSIGRAVFNNQFPLNRTREIVGPVQAPAYWIPRGRDPKLEQAILAKIRSSLFL